MSSNSKKYWLMAAAVFAICATVLWMGAREYMPFLADDTLISLRYSERFLEGKGLTWNDGERVEGYSNLSWVLLLAGFGALGVDLIDASRIAGVACMLLVVLGILYALRPWSLYRLMVALAASLLFVMAGPIRIWAIGGLEQALYAATLVWGLAVALPILDGRSASGRRALCAGIPFALACLTRPDGPLFVAVVAGGLMLWRNWRIALLLAAPSVVAVLGQLVFRKIYYDAWVPNTAHAKLAFTTERVAIGKFYVWGTVKFLLPLSLSMLAAVLLGLVSGSKGRRQAVLISLPILAWCAYLVTIGGDVFPGRRHMVPPIALGALLVGAIFAELPWRNGLRWVALLIPLVALGFMPRAEAKDWFNSMAKKERWEWNGQVIGNLLREGFAEQQPLLACDPGGCLPYWSKLPCLDLMGLNDRHIAMNPPETMGLGFVGHELGDGDYALSRKPDLVLWCYPKGGAVPCFLSGKQMITDPRFEENYRLLWFEGQDPFVFRSQIWVRWKDGKVGVEFTPDHITVPGFLLATGDKAVAKLAAGQMVLHMPKGSQAEFADLPVPAGNWRIETEGQGAAVETTSGATEFSMPADGLISLRALAKDAQGDLQCIRLVRVQ